MLKLNFKAILLNSVMFFTIFFIDRISKMYVISIAELNNKVDVYLSPYLNLYLIWNKGIAFGFLSFDGSLIYNLISTIIAIIILVVLIVMIIKSEGFKKYSLILILGGALGNLFDRVYYSAVPDFLNLSCCGIQNPYIFNIADIFVFIGLLPLILFSERFQKDT